MICEYGCGNVAIHQLKNKKWCCCLNVSGCPSIKEKNKQGLLKAHELGKYKNIRRVAWNAGKTKETDERVKKYGESLSSLYKSGEKIPWQTGKTKENTESVLKTSKKISETVRKKVETGQWHQSFSKRRIHEYKGIKFNGTWELKYAMWLDENNIKWERPTESFPYTFEGEIRRYTPDFYLVDDNEYVEIKGYETPKDRAKWSQFPKKLKILKGKELKELNIIDSYKDVSK